MRACGRSRRFLVLLVALLAVPAALLPHAAAADVGPKTSYSVTVHFYDQGRPIAFDSFYAELVSCGTAGTPVPSIPNTASGPPNPNDPYRFQGSGTKENPSIHFHSYYWVPPPRCFAVAVLVPDTGQLYVTPTVQRTRNNDFFTVDLQPNGAATIAQDTPPPWESDWTAMALFALPLTLLVELSIVYLWRRRLLGRAARVSSAPIAAVPASELALPIGATLPTAAVPSARRLLLVGAVANVLTLPVVWFLAILASMAGPSAALVVLGVLEVFAFLFEGLLYWRPGHLRFGNALALSALANLASFVIGALLH